MRLSSLYGLAILLAVAAFVGFQSLATPGNATLTALPGPPQETIRDAPYIAPVSYYVVDSDELVDLASGIVAGLGQVRNDASAALPMRGVIVDLRTQSGRWLYADVQSAYASLGPGSAVVDLRQAQSW